MENKVPPHSEDVEQTVLGSMLMGGDLLDTAIEKCRPEYFYSSGNQVLFRTIAEMVHENIPIDMVSTREELKKKSNLKKIGGDDYLVNLTEEVATLSSIGHHIVILKEKYMLRKLISLMGEIGDKCFDNEAKPLSLIEQAESELFHYSEDNTPGNLESSGDLLSEVFDDINSYVSEKGVQGIVSGLKDLDAITTGFHGGDLTIIAARPGVGKSAFALNICRNIAYRTADSTEPIALFSLEMSKSQLMERMLCAEAGIDMHALRAGKVGKDQLQKMLQVSEPLQKAPIFIDESMMLNPMQMLAKARKLKRQHGLSMIIMDYLQLMKGTQGHYNTRNDEIGDVSRNLKMISKELDVPVLALSQLSRDVEKRGKNARPQLSDLRESGSIEQDADCVIFIHRPKEKDEEGNVGDDIAEIIVSKQRNGPVGVVKSYFLKQYASFEGFEDKKEDEYTRWAEEF